MIRFDLCYGLIVVPARFCYRHEQIVADCLLDSGSAGTAVEIDLIELDYDRQTHIVELSGIGGNQEVVQQNIEQVEFCGRQVCDFKVQFGDIASEFGFHGIIGSDLLNALGIRIDYERKEISLRQGSGGSGLF